MVDIVRIMKESFKDQEQTFNSPVDPLVDEWLFMSGPWPVVSILAFYLYFVLNLGPKLMEGRKPFNLKYVIIVYNFICVLMSLNLVWQLFGDPAALHYVFTHQCYPKDRKLNPLIYKLNSSAWWYFFSKIIELLDTVFFTLRKKQNQVTVLHVYHHANMVFSTWAYLKYIRGEQGIIYGILNSVVHIVMYSYYLLTAFGPGVQKYLWWKKYITKLQLAQFIFVVIYCVGLLTWECNLPKILTYYAASQSVIFFALFMNFYRQTYIERNNKEKSK